jgi:hypothetical protein
VIVFPGGALKIRVVTTASSGFQFVGIGGDFDIVTSVLKSPPYEFSLRVPVGMTPQEYYLQLVGKTTSGRPISCRGIMIDVERPTLPLSIRVEPGTLVDIPLGSIHSLRVVGEYPDDRNVTLTKSTSTTYVSGNTKVVTVTAEGMVMAVGLGSTAITVNHALPVPVTVVMPAH